MSKSASTPAEPLSGIEKKGGQVVLTNQPPTAISASDSGSTAEILS